MLLTLFASIGGFRIGDILFALISFLAFIFIVIALVIITIKYGSKKKQLQRIEDKLDQVLQEKGR